MDDFLRTLKSKERELRIQLENTPLFKQWEGIRSTIELFENGEPFAEFPSIVTKIHSIKQRIRRNGLEIPKSYNEDLTWNQRVIYALDKLGQGSVSDIVNFLIKQGTNEDHSFLTKRVGVTVSQLKVIGKIKSKKEGKKGIYFL